MPAHVAGRCAPGTKGRVIVNHDRTKTRTAPAGRQTRTVIDAQGRPVQQQLGNLTATEFSYDANGRLDGIAQGSRVSTMAYDAGGNLASVTDPAGRTVSFAYDGAGRVLVQTLPDSRQILFDYDANGNVTSIVPPGRPAHGFSYLPMGQLQYYIPPQPDPPLANPSTVYSYYLDGELARITRPDGQAINLTYDPETGQLLAQALPAGQIYVVVHGDDGTFGTFHMRSRSARGMGTCA